MPSVDEDTTTATEQDTKETTDKNSSDSGTGDGTPKPDDFYPVSAANTTAGTDDFYPVSEPSTKSRSDEQQTSEAAGDPA